MEQLTVFAPPFTVVNTPLGENFKEHVSTGTLEKETRPPDTFARCRFPHFERVTLDASPVIFTVMVPPVTFAGLGVATLGLRGF